MWSCCTRAARSRSAARMARSLTRSRPKAPDAAASVPHNEFVRPSEPARKGWLLRGKAADAAVSSNQERQRRGPGRTLVVIVVLGVLTGIALWLVPELQLQDARARLALNEQLSPS